MRWMVTVIVVAMGCGVCRGDLRGEFEKEYPGAVGKLEEGYKQVRMEGMHVFYYARGGGTMGRQADHFELVRDGDLFREAEVTLKTTDEKWPAGSGRIFGETETQEYLCCRHGAEETYKFTVLGAKPALGAKPEPGDLSEIATAVYRFDQKRLLDFLREGNRERVAVVPATSDGREAIDVISVWHPNPMKPEEVMVQNYYLEPGTWAHMGYQMLRGPVTYTKVIRYEEPREGDGVPRVKWMETYTEDSRKPDGGKQNMETYDVKSLRFEKAEVGELELGALKKLGVGEVPTEEEVKVERKNREEAAGTQP